MRRGPQFENQRWCLASYTRLTCKRAQTKPKDKTGFGPTRGPHQSERETTKDILFLTSIRVSNIPTSVILLACSVWCNIHPIHLFHWKHMCTMHVMHQQKSKHMTFWLCVRPDQAMRRRLLWLQSPFLVVTRQFNNRLASTDKLSAAGWTFPRSFRVYASALCQRLLRFGSGRLTANSLVPGIDFLIRWFSL